MSAESVLQEVKDNFDAGARRRSLPGLLIAWIRCLQELGAAGGKFANRAAFYEAHPRLTQSDTGKKYNTWIVLRDPNRPSGRGSTLSIRGHYDDILHWFHEQKRFDYPSNAPHATQQWPDYEHWLDTLFAMDAGSLQKLEDATKQFVLDKLPEQRLDRSLVKREPPRFYLFLRNFDLTRQKDELSGAAYQGTVFGYLRADASHLQVDVAKVRTGSKRVGRIGDIDARDGELLVLSAEVKQYVISIKEVGNFAEFADQVAEQGALGMVVALDFEDGVRAQLESMGLASMSKDDLIKRVMLWDSLKQNIAVQALLYYVFYIEKSSPLYQRLRSFLDGLEMTPMAKTIEAPPEPGEP